jgi:hypothetical protein
MRPVSAKRLGVRQSPGALHLSSCALFTLHFSFLIGTRRVGQKLSNLFLLNPADFEFEDVPES